MVGTVWAVDSAACADVVDGAVEGEVDWKGLVAAVVVEEVAVCEDYWGSLTVVSVMTSI